MTDEEPFIERVIVLYDRGEPPGQDDVASVLAQLNPDQRAFQGVVITVTGPVLDLNDEAPLFVVATMSGDGKLTTGAIHRTAVYRLPPAAVRKGRKQHAQRRAAAIVFTERGWQEAPQALEARRARGEIQ